MAKRTRPATGSTRIERDSMGELQVPADALWGAQTQRAKDNFHISGRPMPDAFVRSLALVKAAAAVVNGHLGLLDRARADTIMEAATAIAGGAHADQFPVDRYSICYWGALPQGKSSFDSLKPGAKTEALENIVSPEQLIAPDAELLQAGGTKSTADA